MIMKKSVSFSLMVLLCTVLFFSCEKKGDPPVLPSDKTMTIDFSNFAAKKSLVFSNETKGLYDVDNSNWAKAATVAGVWNTILLFKLVIPVMAFKKAVDNQPTYLENKKWEWKYSVEVVGATYKARLTGQIRDNDIKWEMYITKEGAGGFAEFLWFEGTTALDGKSGQWKMNESQLSHVPMLQIDWTITGTEVGSIKYAYIKSGDSFKDSYIQYGLTSNTLNAFYTVHFYEAILLKKFVDVNIEWNTTGHNGRIKSVDLFQDSNWHCWDGNGNNTTCN